MAGRATACTITRANGRASDLEGWVRVLVRIRVDNQGWSVRDLGKAAGIPHMTAWRFLTGASVRGGAMLALLEAVGLEVIETTDGGVPVVVEKSGGAV